MHQVQAILTERPGMTGKYCALAASLLQQQGQLDLAVRLYEDAIAFDPDDTAARYYLGIALQPLGRENEARQQWAEIARRRPHSPEAQLQSGLVQVLDNDREGARKTIAALLATLPDDSTWRTDAARILAVMDTEVPACPQ